MVSDRIDIQRKCEIFFGPEMTFFILGWLSEPFNASGSWFLSVILVWIGKKSCVISFGKAPNIAGGIGSMVALSTFVLAHF